MAGDNEVVHETEPHQAGFESFWTFTKWGTVSVAVIAALVVFIITR
jgi:Bacterial aa3 type cytochrome c oxidase subunit IV